MASQYLTQEATTRRENLLDTVAVRYPAEVPLLRSLPSVQLKSNVVEYTIDRPFASLTTIRSTSDANVNAQLDGADWVDDTVDYPTKLKAYCEINHFAKKLSNSYLPAILAGQSSTFDYESTKLFTKLLNNIENVLMFGRGAATAGGSDTTGSPNEERRAQGLVSWAAWSGLERMHGASSPTTLTDPYGVALAQDYWSVFYDAGSANLTGDMLYNKILATFHRAGGHVPNLLFHVGAKLKGLVAKFGRSADGYAINDRNVDASGLVVYDDIDFYRTPLGTVGFRTNRYLDQEGSTMSIDNRGVTFTPGSPTEGTEGTVSTTLQADEIMVGFEPGTVAVGWYRAPQFEDAARTGDYRRLACVAEYTLVPRHPLCVLGGGNLIA